MIHDDTVGTERTLGRVLSVGTRTSTLLLAAGLVLALLHTGRPASVLLHAGLVLLMATPVLRVAVSILAFARRREWRFVVFTTAVLGLIVSGFLVALAS